MWLTQVRSAELFGVQQPVITKHLINIFDSHELQKDQVSSKMELSTQNGALEGKTQTRSVKLYNLDAIISAGYRVNSKQATQFRIWEKSRQASHAESVLMMRLLHLAFTAAQAA